MFIPLMFAWWYSAGFTWLIKKIKSNFDYVLALFSVGILFRTLFAPWKQIQTHKSLQNFVQTTVDNMISRFVGFSVRFWMLVFAGILIVLTLVFGLIALLLWPVIPALLIILPILTAIGA